MCAMRRQLSGVVKYCLPSSCWPANTSHSRNSAFRRPSPCLVMRPATSACALITRQSAKRGTASELVILSVKARGLIGANSPLCARLLVMTPVMLCATSVSVAEPATKSGIAIGIGWTLPCVMSRRTTAPAGRAAKAASAPAPAPISSRRRFMRGPGPGREKLESKIGSVIGGYECPWLAAKHVTGIEIHFDVFPDLIMIRLEHREGLALEHRAHRAVARGIIERPAA